MAWFVKSFSICILQGLNGKISQAFELSKGTFTQAMQNLCVWWGDHLRLTASVPPAALAAQNGRNPPLFPTPSKIANTPLVYHKYRQDTAWCFLQFAFSGWKFNVARETLLGSPARPAGPCAFPWMHPTCLVPCAALSSCTAVFSRIPIQQLHFLVQWHCWMGTGTAGSQPQPLHLLKIGWNGFRPPRLLLFVPEAIPRTNYSSNNTKGGGYTWFISKLIPWAHLGVEVLDPHPQTGAGIRHREGFQINVLPIPGLQTLFWQSSEEPTGSWKEFTKQIDERKKKNPCKTHCPVICLFSMPVLINGIISELCVCARRSSNSSCTGSLKA